MKKSCLLTIEVEYDDDRIRFNKNGDLTKKSLNALFPDWKRNPAHWYEHEALKMMIENGSVYDIFAVSPLSKKLEGDLRTKLTKHAKKIKRFMNINDFLEE